MLRANSRLRKSLGNSGVEFLEHAGSAVERILPHVEVSNWVEGPWERPNSVWTTIKRTEIRITISIGTSDSENGRSLVGFLHRRRVPGAGGSARRILDTREHDICKRIALRVSEVLRSPDVPASDASIRAIRDAFDEYVVSQHVREHHSMAMPITSVFEALHKLSEQTYENRSLTFGCVLDPERSSTDVEAVFPGELLQSKKYKVLSDGFRTAYGDVLRFLSKKMMYGSPRSKTVSVMGTEKENHTSWERYYRVSDYSSSSRSDWFSGR